ncbi:MAG: hypothetical protein ACYCOU_22390 [Sulfobacillus sp.]
MVEVPVGSIDAKEAKVASMGFKFSAIPRKTATETIEEIVQCVKSSISRKRLGLSTDQMDELATQIRSNYIAITGDWIVPADLNISAEDLKSMSQKHGKNIMFLPSDKNMGFTVVGMDWYRREVRRQFDTAKHYKRIDSQEAAAALHKVIDDTKKFLGVTPRSQQIPVFYVLPKIHKPGENKDNPALPVVKGRPITSMVSCPHVEMAKWLTKQLQSV